MKNKYLFTTVLLIVLTAFLAAVASVGGWKTSREDADILVVTSFYPVYVATLNVTDGMEGVQVRCLSRPQTGCVHDHQLTTQDMRLLEQADVFIINGAGMETYLEDVLRRYPDLYVLDTSKGAALLESAEGHEHAGETSDADHGQQEELQEEEYNAHIWMNMENYSIQIGNIGNGLGKIDEKHRKQYQENVNQYLAKVQKLQKECQNLWDGKDKSAVSTHEAFSYFAQNINWDVARTINMDENTTLNAAQVSEVLEAVQQEQISYLWTEEIYGSRLTELIQQENSCKTIVLDTLVLPSQDETGVTEEKDAYLAGMRNNLEQIRQALAGSKEAVYN